MAMQDSLSASYLRVCDVAKFYSVSVITARRWFEVAEDVPVDGVIMVPSGKQRPRYYLPEAVIRQRLGEMRFPAEQIQRLLDAPRGRNGVKLPAPVVMETPRKPRKPRKLPKPHKPATAEKRRGRPRKGAAA